MSVRTGSDSIPPDKDPFFDEVAPFSQLSTEGMDEESKRDLRVMSEESAVLIAKTKEGLLTKQEIVKEIEALKERWSHLIGGESRENLSSASEFNRVRLVDTFKYVLGIVKVNIMKLEVEEKKSSNEAGWGVGMMRSFYQTSAATAQYAFSALRLNKKPEDVSYQTIVERISSYEAVLERDRQNALRNGTVMVSTSAPPGQVSVKKVATETITKAQQAERLDYEKQNLEQQQRLKDMTEGLELLLREENATILSKCKGAVQSALETGLDSAGALAAGVTEMALQSLGAAACGGAMACEKAIEVGEKLAQVNIEAGVKATAELVSDIGGKEAGRVVTDIAGMASDSLRLVRDVPERVEEIAHQKTNDFVREKAMALDPRKVTGVGSLREILDDYVWYWISKEFLGKIGKPGVGFLAEKIVGKDFQDRISKLVTENASILLEPDHVKQLVGTALRSVAHVMQAINEAGPYATSEEVLQHLKILNQKAGSTSTILQEATDCEDYKVKAQSSAFELIAKKLISKNPHSIMNHMQVWIEDACAFFKEIIVSYEIKVWLLVSKVKNQEYAETYDKKVESGEAKVIESEKMVKEIQGKIDSLLLKNGSQREIKSLQEKLKFHQNEILRRKVKIANRKSWSADIKEKFARDEVKSCKRALDTVKAKSKGANTLKEQEAFAKAEVDYRGAKDKLRLAKKTALEAGEEAAFFNVMKADAEKFKEPDSLFNLEEAKLKLTLARKKIALSNEASFVEEYKKTSEESKQNILSANQAFAKAQEAWAAALTKVEKTKGKSPEIEKEALQQLASEQKKMLTARDAAIGIRKQSEKVKEQTKNKLEDVKQQLIILDQDIDLAKKETIRALKLMTTEKEKPLLDIVKHATDEQFLYQERHNYVKSEQIEAKILAAEAPLRQLYRRADLKEKQILASSVAISEESILNNPIMAALGVSEIAEDFGAHAELLCYYVADQVSKEMGSILDSSWTETVQKELKPDEVKPKQENKKDVDVTLRNEVTHFAEVMQVFINPAPSTKPLVAKEGQSSSISPENREAIKNKALSLMLLSPLFMSVMKRQGEANSICDVCTPLMETLLPLWQDWVK